MSHTKKDYEEFKKIARNIKVDEQMGIVIPFVKMGKGIDRDAPADLGGVLLDMPSFHVLSEISEERRMYNPSEKDQKNIDNNFVYHAPKEGQSVRYILLRDEAKKLAELFTVNCPPSRELSLALTNLEQAVMWANASIARNE